MDATPPPAPGAFSGPRRRQLLRLRGADALDLLHRLSASRLDDLDPGRSRATVFTDDKGKVVDVALAVAHEGAIELLPGRVTTLADWIERFVFTEDVEIETPEEVWTLDWLRGPLPDEFDAMATPLVLGARGIRMDSDSARLKELAERLESDGAQRLDDASRRRWLFRQGILPPGDGLDDRVNALEAGLRPLVDFQKGCYIGQEVIARLENYDKLRRSVASLHGAASHSPKVGDELRSESGAVARVLEVAGSGEGPAVSVLLADRSISEGSSLFTGNENAGTLHWAPAQSKSEEST